MNKRKENNMKTINDIIDIILTTCNEQVIHISPIYTELSTKHKRLLCLQLEFMQAYLFILDLRIEEIEKRR